MNQSENLPLTFFKTVKCWQTQDQVIVWQVSTSAELRSQVHVKKIYLILDGKQNQAGVRLSIKKPGSLDSQGAFVSLLRKHCRGAAIGRILYHGESGDLWLPIYASGSEPGDWYLQLAMGKPPELRLVAGDGTTLVRWSSRGTFTKRKTLSDPLPHQWTDNPADDVTDKLINQLIATASGQKPDDEVRTGTETETEQEGLDGFQRETRNRLNRRLKTTRKALAKLEKTTPDEAAIAKATENAQLLQSCAYLLQPRMDSVTLPPSATGLDAAVTIELDPDLSPGDNIDRLFTSVKKMNRSLTKGSDQIERSREALANLEADLERLRAGPVGEADCKAILGRHHMPIKGQQKQEPKAAPRVSQPFRVFASESGVPILVGKGANENDKLTRAARSNDYWFHVDHAQGSHVVIRARDFEGERPNDALIRQACILAIHYSKARQDKRGEVCMATRDQLKKPKNLPPGTWLVSRAENVYVRYREDELKEILDRHQPDGLA